MGGEEVNKMFPADKSGRRGRGSHPFVVVVVEGGGRRERGGVVCGEGNPRCCCFVKFVGVQNFCCS